MDYFRSAIKYAALGIAVFPLWHVSDDGRCGCGDAECASPGKHPMTGRGFKDATLDPDVIQMWWGVQPEPNIGGVMGDVVALDEDRPGALLELAIELPPGPVTKTARGHHYFFKANGHRIGGTDLAPGINVRGHGGYVVLPPSRHVSGHVYAPVPGHELGEIALPDIPEEIARRLTPGASTSSSSHRDLFGRLKINRLVAELDALPADAGGRWRELMLQLVAHFVGIGMGDEAIVLACRGVTRTDLGFTFEQTEAWIRAALPRTRAKFDQPEPVDEDFADDEWNIGPRQASITWIAADTIAPKPIRWTWHPYVPAGQMTLLAGRGGVGKGLIGCSLAAAVTTGRPWPLSEEEPEIGKVAWCETEDPKAEVLVPRLIAAGADRRLVRFMDRESFLRLDPGFVAQEGVRLIILSPFISFLGLNDIRDEQRVRAALEQVQAFIEGTACAVLGLAHLNKKSDLDAVDRILGSVSFVNFVRSVLLATAEPAKDDEEPCYRLVHAKANLSARGDDLLYTTTNVGLVERGQKIKVDWLEVAGENVDPSGAFDRNRKPRGPNARDWLVQYLESSGETPRSKVIEDGKIAGLSEASIVKAHYREQRCQYRRDGFGGPTLWSII